MFLFDGSRQHDNLLRTTGHKSKASLGRANGGKHAKFLTQTPDFDSQASAMRFIDEPCTECTSKENVSRHIFGPRFAQRTCKRK